MMEEEDKIVQKTSRIRLIKDKMAGSIDVDFYVSVCVVGRADRYWSGAEIFAYFTRQIPVGVI